MPPRIKAGANYHNSRLAQHEAVRNGFDTTLLLNQRGNVSEAPGSCVMMVRKGELVTPPGTSGVLEGITVATVAELAGEHFGLTLSRGRSTAPSCTRPTRSSCAARCPSCCRSPASTGSRSATASPARSPALQEHYDNAVRNVGDHPQWCTPVVAREEVPA